MNQCARSKGIIIGKDIFSGNILEVVIKNQNIYGSPTPMHPARMMKTIVYIISYEYYIRVTSQRATQFNVETPAKKAIYASLTVF